MLITLKNIHGEEREGFYIQPIMKRVWAVELDILRKINELCQRHQIRYWGWYGTMLGAVRHQGFIPWDDDIDLAMLREDYERFRYYAKTELPKEWVLFRSSPALICVKNTGVPQVNQEFLDRYHGCPYSVGIDIFCLDRIPHDRRSREMHASLFRAVRALHMNWDLDDEAACWEGGNRQDYLRDVEKLTGYSIDKSRSVKEQLYDLADMIAAMYQDTEYTEVSFVPRLYEKPNEIISISCFARMVETPFESTMLPIIEDYDSVCRLYYGDDYMTPKRAYDHHDYPFFRNQTEWLRNFFEKQNEILPEFFDITDA